MLNIRQIACIVFWFLVNFSLAQAPISGVVLDEHGQPMPFATVKVLGTGLGAVADVDGEFILDTATPTDTLQFSFIGYQSEYLVVGNRAIFEISLHPEFDQLDEVVVVGYGSQKKLNVTGSVVTLDARKLESRGVTNVSNMLAGNSPGLTVLQRGGSPGRNGGSLRIRGIGTLGAGEKNDPLIIVDGIETGSLADINPNDIDNVSILKDAAASSIYGVRAANGVVIITTKRGQRGVPVVNYGLQIGLSEPVNLPDKVSSTELAELYSEGQRNEGLTTRLFSLQDIALFESGESILTHANTDHLNEVFRQPGIREVHNLSVAGGGESVRYNMSLGYTNEEGNMDNTGFKRYNFRTNLDLQASEKLTFGFNLSGAQGDIIEPIVGVGGIIHRAYREWATDPLQTLAGNWAIPAFAQENGVLHNSVGLLREGGEKQFVDSRFTGTAIAEYKLTDFLSVKGVAATILDFNRRKELTSSLSLHNLDESLFSTERSRILEGRDNITDHNLQLLLTFEKSFEDHEVSGLLGTNRRQIETTLSTFSVFDLRSDDLDQINAGDLTQDDVFGNTSDYGLQSYFGRINYSFKGRYLFESNLRYDGTSRFSRDRRYQAFPSFSVGWRLADEPFFDVHPIIDLKLRASWGRLGNQEIGDYRFLNTYVFDQTAFLGGVEQSGATENLPIGNADILWETTEVTNYGLDLTMLNGRLSFTGEYFVRTTKDVLIQRPLPAIFGSGLGNFPFVNAASTRNLGFELSLSFQQKFDNGLRISASSNFSKVDTKIRDLAGTDQPGIRVGDPIANVFGYEAIGIFQNQDEIDGHANQEALGATPRPGDIKYQDLNGDGLVNPEDRKNLGSFFPGINYGLSMNITFRNWDFGMLWQGVGDVVGEIAGRQRQPFWLGSSPWKLHLDRAQVDRDGEVVNPGSRYPRVLLNSGDKNNLTSSWWVESTAFLKLRNMQIGYTLPEKWIGKLNLKKVRIYASGENLLTLTKFDGFDPEIPTSGTVLPLFSGDAGYPVTMTLLMGLNITF